MQFHMPWLFLFRVCNEQAAVVTLIQHLVYLVLFGSPQASEVEEQVDPILARSFVDNPELMMDSDIHLLKDTLRYVQWKSNSQTHTEREIEELFFPEKKTKK